MQETWVRSLGWEDPLEKGMSTLPGFWPRELHGQNSPAGYIVQGVAKNWTHLSDFYCHSSKEQASFNLVAAVTIYSAFEAKENKICHCFHFSPFYLP